MQTIGTMAVYLALISTTKEKLAFWGMLICIIGDLFATP